MTLSNVATVVAGAAVLGGDGALCGPLAILFSLAYAALVGAIVFRTMA